MIFRLLALCLLVAGALNTPAHGQAAELFPDEPVVRPGDILVVQVLNDLTMSGELTVHSNGSLIHPLYREIRVAGVPFSQLDLVMAEFLSRDRSSVPLFSVEPLLPVVVTGEVLEGGLQRLGPAVTIAQAVTLAGLNAEARFDRVKLIRNRTLYEVDFTDPEAQWGSVTIRSGDQVIVERQPNFMRDVVQPVTTTLGALSSLISFVLFLTGGF